MSLGGATPPGRTDRFPDGIEVQYVYSACVVLRTPDISILCDPWFTDGVYDGAWFAFPKIADPLGEIGDVDAVWISHIHPDHYDPAFLRRYFEAFGRKPILIANHQPNVLAAKMRTDGFEPQVVSAPRQVGSTRLSILPHATGGPADVDSALIVQVEAGGRRHSLVNANDIVFDAAMTARVAEAAGPIDLLLCGYTGAGPYPQTYFDPSDPELATEGERKKADFFDRYRRLVAALDPRATLPFAGQYLLGGRLAGLNAHRGVADATEVLALDPRAVVLADGGGRIDTAKLTPSAQRREPYPAEAVAARLAEIAGRSMAYERLIPVDEAAQLPLRRLLAIAYPRALSRSHVESDYFFAIALGEDGFALMNARRDAAEGGGGLSFVVASALDGIEPLSRIAIDPRYLFGLLTHVYHWNNAEIGSQYQTRRHGRFDRNAQAFLNNLAV